MKHNKCWADKQDGRTFERLTVICRGPNKGKHPQLVVQCACGHWPKLVYSHHLKRGLIKSCGCLQRETVGEIARTHGQSLTATYISWTGMKSRCFNKRQPNFQHYGAKGVTVCNRWLQYENFLSDMGERPVGKTLDRVDPTGNYEPDNCRWATPMEQTHNRRGSK